MAEGKLKSLGDFETDLKSVENNTASVARSAIEKTNGNTLTIRQAEWHVRGLTYHCRNLVQHYGEVAQGVGQRAVATGANIVVMHAPQVQKMWCEFYALVNLARITLDNLRLLLRPVFTTPLNQLPKSITEFSSETTDCPVYCKLGEDKSISYLSDIRNCIVHYRTFATSDNAFVSEDGVSEGELTSLTKDSDVFQPMAKAMFRRIGGTGVSVNFYLPDTIFVRSGNDKKLAPFTYNNRFNMLSMSLGFVHSVAAAVLCSFGFLVDPGKPTFIYDKKGISKNNDATPP